MTFDEARRFLESLAPFGMRFGLERMQRVLGALGHPERRYPVLHVAGTNGKGSTCAFAAAMLRAHGLRVGLYTSPHLVDVRERIQVDGVNIGPGDFAACMQALLAACPEVRDEADPLTYFECGTALALLHFARAGVDAVVLETGLGGRLDATNAVPAAVTAITRIALDHTAVLGPTLEAIAAEKAGIFKPGATVVLARQPPAAEQVLVARALAVGQPPRRAGRDFALEGEGPFTFRSGEARIEGLQLALRGPHQRFNAEVAIEAVRAFVPGLDDAAVRRGLARTVWPGRLEEVARQPPIVLDGAHNPDGAQALVAAIAQLYPGAPVHLVFGVLADKDVEQIAAALLPTAASLTLVPPPTGRALPLPELQALASRHGLGGHPVETVAEALERARMHAQRQGGIVLVAGSLYLVGEARRLLVAA